MCLSNDVDFSEFTLQDFFRHCDSASSLPTSNRLLDYLAWSNNPGFDAKACLEAMSNRVSSTDPASHDFNFKSWESKIFSKRMNLLASNNKAYEIATKFNPTTTNLEDFSKIDPCFSTLFPGKIYLSDHPDQAMEYRGMLPFGREVVAYYNTIVEESWLIDGSPTFKDHVRLRDLSNRKAIFMGVPTITINNLMYQFGKKIRAAVLSNVDDQD
jgi:hypothetical protein